MKVLITGASGFTGIHMVDLLSTKDDVDLTGLTRRKKAVSQNSDRISWVDADLLDPDQVRRVISKIQPDSIVHLAGITKGSLRDLLETNVVGTKNLLDAIAMIVPECRILLISSSAIYGYSGNAPISEATLPRPLSEYGISKFAQESLSLLYHDLFGTNVAIARAFNLIGPGQPNSFVCGRIIQQIVDIEQGVRDGLEIFELSSRRDFIDVRDAVKGYWELLSHPEFKSKCSGKAFNIGSGKAPSISDVLDIIEKITAKQYPVHVPAITAPSPIPSQQSDNSLIYDVTGWRPRINLEHSLGDMLYSARKKTDIC